MGQEHDSEKQRQHTSRIHATRGRAMSRRPERITIYVKQHYSGYRATVCRDSRPLYITTTKTTPEQARAAAKQFTDLLTTATNTGDTT